MSSAKLSFSIPLALTLLETLDVMALVTSRAKRERAGMEPPQESGVYCVSQPRTILVKRIRKGDFLFGSYRCVYSKHPA